MKAKRGNGIGLHISHGRNCFRAKIPFLAIEGYGDLLSRSCCEFRSEGAELLSSPRPREQGPLRTKRTRPPCRRGAEPQQPQKGSTHRLVRFAFYFVRYSLCFSSQF